MIELTQFDFGLYNYKHLFIAHTVLCEVITLTQRINCNYLKNKY